MTVRHFCCENPAAQIPVRNGQVPSLQDVMQQIAPGQAQQNLKCLAEILQHAGNDILI